MVTPGLLDVAPDPVRMGIVLAVILAVVALVLLLVAALVFFLWYRKRSRRGVEMIRPDALSADSAQHAHPGNPNQP